MRVLHFFKTYWPDTFGGVERTIHALAKGCSARGINVDVLALSAKPAEKPFQFAGHRVIQVRRDLDIASTAMSLPAFSAFRALSREADIVHYHFPWPFMDLVDLLTPPGKPTVVTYHSDIVKQRLLLGLYRPLMGHFLGQATRLVATSPNYCASSTALSRHAGRTTVIPLGLDEADAPVLNDSLLARWRRRFPNGFFLFVGVLRYYKGLHILLDAARQCGLPIVIVGAGGIEQALRARVEAEGLTNVHLLGALPDVDKHALLHLCTGFVFPSHLRSEAFGLSLVEASMRGKPMISTEIGTGTSFVNLDQKTGIVVPPADSVALSRAMQHLWNDPTLRTTMGRAARLRYESEFTADIMVTRYSALYESLL